MSVSTLTPTLVRNAKPRRKSYIIRDRKCKGLGLRVNKSGLKRFVLDVHRYGIHHYETFGNVETMPLKEARAYVRKRVDVLRSLERASPETPFEVVAEAAIQRMAFQWKPGTTETNRTFLKSTILPYFKGRTIGSVTRADVEEWFAGLHDKPGAANRSAPLLSVIMREAEEIQARPPGSNPVTGLRRYRRPKKERVLTRDEMARVGAALAKREATYPLRVAMLRLILLTGCRKGEVANLHWKDYRDGHLHLPDSKTGAKTIYLSSHARSVLEGVLTPRSGPVFPPKRSGSRPICIRSFWMTICRDIGLEGVRVHDLRHNYASVAIGQKASLATIGTLLGHTDPQSTLRYAHLDDATLLDAVELIGGSMPAKAEGGVS